MFKFFGILIPFFQAKDKNNIGFWNDNQFVGYSEPGFLITV